jgi:hypothetical protein
MIAHPIGSEGPELVADVEANMVAFLEIDEVGRSRRLACQPFAFGRRDQAVATTENDQQRTFYLVGNVVKAEAACDFEASTSSREWLRTKNICDRCVLGRVRNSLP